MAETVNHFQREAKLTIKCEMDNEMYNSTAPVTTSAGDIWQNLGQKSTRCGLSHHPPWLERAGGRVLSLLMDPADGGADCMLITR